MSDKRRWIKLNEADENIKNETREGKDDDGVYSPRTGHCIIHYDKKIYLFGGEFNCIKDI